MLKNLVRVSKQYSCVSEIHPKFKCTFRSFAYSSRDFTLHKLLFKTTRKPFEFSVFNNRLSTVISENNPNQNACELSRDSRLSKAFVSMRYTRLVKCAVREKGPHPQLNRNLADVIEEAQRHQVPMQRIEAAIAQAVDVNSQSGILELSIPKVCYMVIECESNDILKPTYDIHKVCEKYPFIILDQNLLHKFFLQKGILRMSVQQNNQLGIAAAENILSDIGAQSVQQVHNENGDKVLEFQCDPSHLHQVKNSLKKTGYVIEEAYVGYMPISTVKLSAKGKDALYTVMSDIGELFDVNRIYHDLELE